MERTLLTDGDWATIDGRLCLVMTFVPMAKVQGDSVIAMNATMPYGSAHIKREELPDRRAESGDATVYRRPRCRWSSRLLR